MEMHETVMVNRASLAARSALGSTKDVGQRKMLPMPWMVIICLAMASASGVRLYSPVSQPVQIRSTTFSMLI